MFDLLLNKAKDKTSSYFLKVANRLFEDGFTDYVYYKHDVEIINEERILCYSFYLRNALLNSPFVRIWVDSSDTIVKYDSSFDYKENIYNTYTLACIMLYEHNNEIEKKDTMNYNIQKERIVNEFVSLEEKILKEEYEKRRSESLHNIKRFLNELNSNDYIPLQNKVHLECYIELNRNSSSLKFKVGYDKMYVVGNIYKFFTAIHNSEELSYGKNFSFNHSLDNFDNDSIKLINFSEKLETNGTYSSAPSLNVSDNDIDELFSILKGKVLYITRETYGLNLSSHDKRNDVIKKLDFRNIPYSVSLDEVDLSITLNSKYYLNIDDNTHIILYGKKYDYILINNKVNIIKAKDKNYRALIRRLYENNGESFKYIEDVFREDIYPRFNKVIKVDESIKAPLKLKDYRIESYFDYQDEVLLLDTKYLCNDLEIKEEEITGNDFYLKKYHNYIDSLGFIDGKVKDIAKITNFLHSDLSSLQEVSDVFLSNNIKNLKVRKASKVTTHMSYMSGMLNICFEKSEFSDSELANIIKSIKKGIKYVKLNKNTIIEIDDELSGKLLNTVNEFNLDINKLTQEQSVPLYQSLKLLDEDLDIIDYKIDEDLKKLLKDISNYKKAKFEFPKVLESVARPYQKEAFLWMKTLVSNNFCGVLADDMGLGKTFEIISLLLTDDKKLPSLIVCPKSLCYNWKNEFYLWGKEFEVINVIGLGPERKEIINNIKSNERKIYISSYDSLRNDIELYKDIKFRYVILDEAQSIKNHETKKSQSVRLLNSEIRFVLTGTPIENTIIDLWSIFDFLMPNYLGRFHDFKSEFEQGIVFDSDKELLNRLVKKITPFVLRRTKEKVLKDLPSKVEFIRIASMETEQKKVYAAELKRTREMLESLGNSGKMEILASLTRLRQICVDPKLYMDNYNGNSCKIDLLMEITKEYIDEGHKIVIFSQFVSVFPRIEKLLKELKISYFKLTGATDAIDRINMANIFNDPDSTEKVFLVSLRAGGTGLNLIGADVVIHLDPWWNYAVEEQATDRTHRIGQTRSVNVIKMIVEDSIEQKVIELQKIKKEISSKIIQNDTDNIEKLSVDDISYLLK